MHQNHNKHMCLLIQFNPSFLMSVFNSQFPRRRGGAFTPPSRGRPLRASDFVQPAKLEPVLEYTHAHRPTDDFVEANYAEPARSLATANAETAFGEAYRAFALKENAYRSALKVAYGEQWELFFVDVRNVKSVAAEDMSFILMHHFIDGDNDGAPMTTLVNTIRANRKLVLAEKGLRCTVDADSARTTACMPGARLLM
jgi:hypothetical protein